MARTVLKGARYPGDIAFEGSKITDIGTILPRTEDVVINIDGDIITSGLINTHHHLYQWMTRGLATGCDLFQWLRTLYPIWGRMSVEDVHAAALVGLSELALTGCTTASDHHYIVPNNDDAVFDAIVEAAKAVGADIAKKLLDKSISSAVFDRGGFVFHGRVQALAQGAREAGLKF